MCRLVRLLESFGHKLLGELVRYIKSHDHTVGALFDMQRPEDLVGLDFTRVKISKGQVILSYSEDLTIL